MYVVHGTPPLTGFPGDAPARGLPVFGSTLAATASQMGFNSCQAANSPPGMSDGPKRAPSSPPETPLPMSPISECDLGMANDELAINRVGKPPENLPGPQSGRISVSCNS